jgi:hypothetical protein
MMLLQASQLNNRGVQCLMAGQMRDAVVCFRHAIALIAHRSATGCPTQDDTGAPQQLVRMVRVPLNAAAAANEKEEALFLINAPSRAEALAVVSHSNQALSMCSAALIFNCAVAVELQCEARNCAGHGTSTCQLKACMLYDQFWKVLSMVINERSMMPLSIATMNTVIHKMAKKYHQLGQFQTVRNLLDTLLHMELFVLQDLQSMDNRPSAEAA